MQLAVESSFVSTEVIEISELPHLARELGVTSVPRLQVGGRVLLGAQSEASVLETVFGPSGNHGNV